MSIITLLLMLVIAAVVIYAIRLAFAGQWKELVITVVIVILVLWILQAFGLTLPNLPRG